MYVFNTEQVELATYQLNGVSRTWFEQWIEGTDENAPPTN